MAGTVHDRPAILKMVATGSPHRRACGFLLISSWSWGQPKGESIATASGAPPGAALNSVRVRRHPRQGRMTMGLSLAETITFGWSSAVLVPLVPRPGGLAEAQAATAASAAQPRAAVAYREDPHADWTPSRAPWFHTVSGALAAGGRRWRTGPG